MSNREPLTLKKLRQWVGQFQNVPGNFVLGEEHLKQLQGLIGIRSGVPEYVYLTTAQAQEFVDHYKAKWAQTSIDGARAWVEQDLDYFIRRQEQEAETNEAFRRRLIRAVQELKGDG